MVEQLPFDAFFDDVDNGYKGNSPKAKKRHAGRAVSNEKQFRRNPKPITPRNAKQASYIESLKTNSLTFAIGPAGVGKTYVPARVFGEMLSQKQIEKIYVARPPVAKPKHRMGYLPGDQKDKTDPWLVPIYEGLKDALGPAEFARAKDDLRIEVVPFEFIQGRTFKNAACIVDEAENLDIDDLYITLTRQGEGLQMVLCGDINQARIPDSGLAAVIDIGIEDEHEGESVIVFNENEVVRSRQAAQWVKSFAKRPGLLGFKPVRRRHENLQNVTYSDTMTEADDAIPGLPDFITSPTR